jgi:hypothetical protein
LFQQKYIRKQIQLRIMKTYYVSITGLQLKSMLHFPRFGYFSGNAMRQAKQAEGNVSADGNYVNGVLHTLSVWKDRKSMTRFMASGAHARAMKISDEISLPGNTYVYGYETDTIPNWEDALAIWRENKIVHGGSEKRKTPTAPLGRKSGGGGFWTTSTTAMLVVVAALVPMAALHLTESMQTLTLNDIA